MGLTPPNLDDRRFQDLVDDAKRFVQERCPGWTDHNVSDPGVTLIEAFVWMTDLLLYRVNRVPDLNYVRFLELIGVTLLPPGAARTEVDFRLAAPADEDLVIPQGTEVSTRRTPQQPSIPFSTVESVTVVATSADVVGSMIEPDVFRDHTHVLAVSKPVTPFNSVPEVGDAIYLGLGRVAPSNTLLVRVQCDVAGAGVDPRNPPLVWEAWSAEGKWVECPSEEDTTLGLNAEAGSVEVHLPPDHETSIIDGRVAGWVRCRVNRNEGDSVYTASPRVRRITAVTIGATAPVINAVYADSEELGVSAGVAGQEFQLPRWPVVESRNLVVEVLDPNRQSGESARLGDLSDDGGWERWEVRTNFADSGPEDRHVTVDAATGVVRFGPMVRLSTRTVRHYGAVPVKGALIRCRSYLHGGGAEGNVAAGSITVLRTSIPKVASVRNRRAASEGVDGESIDEAKVRGPVALRTRNRAVTIEDFEHLAREADSAVARVKCVPAEDSPGDVRVLVVPAASADGRIDLATLVPSDEMKERVRSYLEERRLAGTSVNVEPPSYVVVTVMAEVRARAQVDPAQLSVAVLDALYLFLNPITGGPSRSGWPFGRSLHVGDVYACLHAVPGVEFVESVELIRVSQTKTESAGERIELGPTNMLISYDHKVRVLRSDA